MIMSSDLVPPAEGHEIPMPMMAAHLFLQLVQVGLKAEEELIRFHILKSWSRQA